MTFEPLLCDIFYSALNGPHQETQGADHIPTHFGQFVFGHIALKAVSFF